METARLEQDGSPMGVRPIIGPWTKLFEAHDAGSGLASGYLG